MKSYIRHKKPLSGQHYKLNNGNTAEVIKYINCHNVLIKVLETGTILSPTFNDLRLGKVYDCNQPIYFGRGYIGEGKHTRLLFSDGGKEYYNPVFTLWVNMLKRVYYHPLKAYRNVTIDPSWWCFQVFADDVQKLPGYEDWIRGAASDLDKDLLSPRNAKRYSPSTCQFVPTTVNRGIARRSKGGIMLTPIGGGK